MKIETKYEHGDTLWFIEDNKVKSAIFTELKIECKYSGYADGGWGVGRTYPINIYYGYGDYNKPTMLHQNQLFTSKEELIKSL